MANPNNPFGFRPMMRMGGSVFSTTEYGKAAADSQAIFMFDMTCRVSPGTAIPLPESSNFNLPVCNSYYSGTPGTTLVLGASLNYGAASSPTPHFITDEVDIIYMAQLKTGTAFSTTSHAMKNANISLTTAGSTATKQSGMTIDGGTIGTATKDVKITRLALISGNAEGQNAILECVINQHYFSQTSVAVLTAEDMAAEDKPPGTGAEETPPAEAKPADQQATEGKSAEHQTESHYASVGRGRRER